MYFGNNLNIYFKKKVYKNEIEAIESYGAKTPFQHIHTVLIFVVIAIMFCLTCGSAIAQINTIIISAEGLADPDADTYQRDRGKLLDALRMDAKRQVVEKAVGSFVDSSTLVENYALIHDKVLTRTKGIIKQVIKESPPWKGQDGFMHMLMKAEVYLSPIKETLREMSRAERISLLHEYGNPKISVAITIRDAKRGSNVLPERSPIAENLLKQRFSRFGYRVWSEEESSRLKVEIAERAMLSNQVDATLSVTHLKSSDFSIRGEVKFKSLSAKLKASGITITKYALTSWTIKCVDNNTGEEVYFNNKVPRNKSWSDEDAAMSDIGNLIGQQFSKEFFESHLMRTSKVFQLQVFGLPSYDAGTLLKKEMIGLRPVLGVDFRNFDAKGLSLYEIDFVGSRGNFTEIINDSIVKPLNQKFREKVFGLVSAQGDVVRLNFSTESNLDDLLTQFSKSPPASLAGASPDRIKVIAQSKEAMAQIAQINPEAVQKLSEEGDPMATKVLDVVNDF